MDQGGRLGRSTHEKFFGGTENNWSGGTVLRGTEYNCNLTVTVQGLDNPSVAL
jgi:hypothetical protein